MRRYLADRPKSANGRIGVAAPPANVVPEGSRLIPLSQGYCTLIDEADFDLVSQFKWHASVSASGSARAWRNYRQGPNNPVRRIALARFLLGDPPGLVVDHINGDTLDDRRQNLRAVTQAQNAMNRRSCRDGYKGVFRNRRRFQAQIHRDGKTYCLGLFKTEIEAALAYDVAARRLHGEFARLNFPDGQVWLHVVRTLTHGAELCLPGKIPA